MSHVGFIPFSVLTFIFPVRSPTTFSVTSLPHQTPPPSLYLSTFCPSRTHDPPEPSPHRPLVIKIKPVNPNSTIISKAMSTVYPLPMSLDFELPFQSWPLLNLQDTYLYHVHWFIDLFQYVSRSHPSLVRSLSPDPARTQISSVDFFGSSFRFVPFLLWYRQSPGSSLVKLSLLH